MSHHLEELKILASKDGRIREPRFSLFGFECDISYCVKDDDEYRNPGDLSLVFINTKETPNWATVGILLENNKTIPSYEYIPDLNTNEFCELIHGLTLDEIKQTDFYINKKIDKIVDYFSDYDWSNFDEDLETIIKRDTK